MGSSGGTRLYNGMPRVKLTPSFGSLDRWILFLEDGLVLVVLLKIIYDSTILTILIRRQVVVGLAVRCLCFDKKKSLGKS
jgi:hypothetical protein